VLLRNWVRIGEGHGDQESDQEGDVQLGVHGGAVVLENGGHVSGGFFFEKVFGVPQSPLTGPMCNHYME
jgi:hypothetical protein